LLLWLYKKSEMKIFINRSQDSLEKLMGTHCNALCAAIIRQKP
jgi:hypothetical protein